MSEPTIEQLAKSSHWETNHSSIWLATILHLHRNIERFKFPSKMDLPRRQQIVALLGKELVQLTPMGKMTVLKAEDLSAHEKELLAEHFFSHENILPAHQGEAFVLNQDASFFATINLRDHLHLQLLDYSEDIEAAWNRLVKLEMELGKSIAYAFSPKFGFMTADPQLCGTGLQVQIFLQLPALIQSGLFERILKENWDVAVTAHSLQGKDGEWVGDIVVLQNQYALGVNEENIISALRSQVTKLILAEKSERSHLRREGSPEIKDKVSRAFGLLQHSYQMSTIEALNAISLIKLGTELEWVEGCDLAALNTLFFHCHRAHLLHEEAETMTQEEVIHKRAEFIHTTLKDVKLTI